MSKIKAIFVAVALGVAAIGVSIAASNTSYACPPNDPFCGN